MQPKQKSNSAPSKKNPKNQNKNKPTSKIQKSRLLQNTHKHKYFDILCLLIFPQKNYDKTKQPISSTEEKSSIFITHPVEYPP